MDGHFSEDALRRIFLEGCSRMVIFGRTLMDVHLSENAHDSHFREDALGRSF